MSENFEYQLSKSLQYTIKGGDTEETGTISIHPPSMDNYDESTEFDQIVVQALVTAGKLSPNNGVEVEEGEGPKKNPSAKDLKTICYMSPDVKIKDITRVFKKLICKSGYLSDTLKVKDSHLSKLSIADFEGLVFGYAAFFTFPSLLVGEEPNTSG